MGVCCGFVLVEYNVFGVVLFILFILIYRGLRGRGE